MQKVRNAVIWTFVPGYRNWQQMGRTGTPPLMMLVLPSLTRLALIGVMGWLAVRGEWMALIFVPFVLAAMGLMSATSNRMIARKGKKK